MLHLFYNYYTQNNYNLQVKEKVIAENECCEGYELQSTGYGGFTCEKIMKVPKRNTRSLILKLFNSTSHFKNM